MSPLLRSSWWCALLLCACADDPTQIVVVVNTDVEAGTDIERVELEVDGSVISEVVPPSPRTALLKHSGGELGPIRVLVRGLRGGLRRIEREAVVDFVEGKTLLLNLCLSRDCLEDTSCAGSRTCTEDGCRSPVIDELPEYNGTIPTSCGAIVGEDAGMSDAAIDADDAGIDGGPPCVLTGGICNVGDTVIPGDRLEPMACDGPGPPLTWQWGPSGALADVVLPFIADTPGTYELEATQPGAPGCTASFTVEVADMNMASTDGMPGTPVIDFAATPGLAFATTGGPEAWAIHPSRGWSDMRISASGNEPSGNLESVGVLTRRPVFGTVEDEGGVYPVMSAPDFSANDWNEINLSGSDDRGYALSGHADGSPPLAIAYGEGIGVLNNLSGATEMLEAYSAGYDADIAISIADPDAYGQIWVLSRDRQEVVNVDLDGGPELNGGSPDSTDIGEPNAIEVTENSAGRANLWLCGDAALYMYDLRGGIDLDAPDATTSVAPCHDVAVDGRGGIWVATPSGLQRFDADGMPVASLAHSGGYSHVAYAEGSGGRREVWAVATADNAVHRVTDR